MPCVQRSHGFRLTACHQVSWQLQVDGASHLLCRLGVRAEDHGGHQARIQVYLVQNCIEKPAKRKGASKPWKNYCQTGVTHYLCKVTEPNVQRRLPKFAPLSTLSEPKLQRMSPSGKTDRAENVMV